MRKVDADQTTLFDRLNELSRDFYSLQGDEHRAMMEQHHHRRWDDQMIRHNPAPIIED